MKKILFITVLLSALFICNSCSDSNDEVTLPFTQSNKKVEVSEYTTDTFSIVAKGETDKIVVLSKKELRLISSNDVNNDDPAPEFTLTGTFEGKITNTTKGTVLNLSGVTLKNTNDAAIYSLKKIELSAKKSTENLIIASGKAALKKAAVYSEKGIEIGGKGNLTIKSNMCHGIKGGDVKLKGSVNLLISGDIDNPDFIPDGSAINSNTFLVEEDKSFNASFQHFKHGVKADETIDIASGTFDLSEIRVAFKTDKAEDGGITGNHIYITGGTISAPQIAVNNIYTDDLQIAEGILTVK